MHALKGGCDNGGMRESALSLACPLGTDLNPEEPGVGHIPTGEEEIPFTDGRIQDVDCFLM